MMTSLSLDRREFTPGSLAPQSTFHDSAPRPLASPSTSCRSTDRVAALHHRAAHPVTRLLPLAAAPHACQTVVLVHGLEGSSESHYMHGIAAKAYRAGFNVIRMNQRTCGGTEHLTPTLYNTGLSQDYRAIVQELARVDGLNRIWLVGYSMGGNLVLKAAGEAGSSEAALAGAIAVCPTIDPPQCVEALEAAAQLDLPQTFSREIERRDCDEKRRSSPASGISRTRSYSHA